MSFSRFPGGRARGLDVLIRPGRRGGLELQCLPEVDGGPPEAFEPPVSAGQLPARLAALEGRILESAGECGGAEAFSRRHVRTGSDASPSDLDVDELARKLYMAVFQPRLAAHYQFEQGAAQGPEGGSVRLRLVLDPAEEETAFLCSLPWELMTPPHRATPLALDPARTVVRALKPKDTSLPALPWPRGEALRVLVAGAAPEGESPLDLQAEVEAIRAAGRGYAMPEFGILLPASAASLRGQLVEQRPHVLHLMCHGDFDPRTGEGTLILAGERGDRDPRSSREVARLLAGFPRLLLVVLNACRGGQFPRRRGLDPWSGVAQTLVREGIPAVVAHQFPISDRAAIAFGGGLYSRLTAGEPLEAAVAEGRQAITASCRGSLEWVTPALYTRFDPSARPVEEAASGYEPVRSKVLGQSQLIINKTEGFTGRKWIFDRLNRFREHCRQRPQGGYFEVYGDPGVGKTALLAETVRRLDAVHHFNIRGGSEARTSTFLENLCAQIILRFGLPYGSLPPETARDDGVLSRLLAEVSARIDRTGLPEVFAIDALDEAEPIGLPDTNPLFLPPYLPPGIVFLLSSQRLAKKPELRCERDGVDLDASSADNLADVREHLGKRFGHPQVQAYLAARKKSEEEFVQLLTEKSEGNFMYLHYVLSNLELKGETFPDLEELPVGLEGYYETHWKRMRIEDAEERRRLKVQTLLALAVATEPLSPEMIAGQAGVSDELAVVSVLREWRPFLRVTACEDKFGKFFQFSIYHDSFRSFLNEKEELQLQAARLRAMRYLAQGPKEGGA